MPRIPIEIDLEWYHIALLKEIEEKHYNTHKIVPLIKKIAERNIHIICKLFEWYKRHDGIDDIKTFIETEWDAFKGE
ncbi:MAG: hypothetical protein ACFFDF_14200 [Candidatus Odinarchaeota archaeon]